MKIGEKTFVSLAYELNVDGQMMDSATADHPLEFVYGAGFLIPGFETNIKNLGTGDKFKFTLAPADGYGEILQEAMVKLPKDVFIVDGSIEEGLLEIGNQIPMSTQEGQHMLGVVKEVTEESVEMDFNHPLAGKTLNFTGEVVGVREVTDADLTQGFGMGGCSPSECDSCDDSSCGSHDEECGCN